MHKSLRNVTSVAVSNGEVVAVDSIVRLHGNSPAYKRAIL
jgi:hypothetical protein